MNIVKSGSGVTHRPLLRAFKQPLKNVGYAQAYLAFFDVPFHICNLFKDELQEHNF